MIATPAGFDPPSDPMDGVRSLFGSPDPVTWLFTGDSVTQGSAYLHGHRDYTQLFAERVRVELKRSADAVINTAVGGRTIAAVAADADRAILRYRPDVVIFGAGLNDSRGGAEGVASFVDTYRDLCRQVGAAGARIVLQTPNGFLPSAADFIVDHLASYTEAIRALAVELALPLIDHAEVWATATDEAVPDEWIGSGCHPNHFGHRVMANAVLRSLGIFDPDSATCRLYIP
ncbi:lysophospholipase L1-like esterase [Kribbella aluminosa]|uniref:Lysophospholipase L1-like esterase n=1 Tax=Kribbella aluminosa TaxID=416017 RepID=A0ABS4UTP3_9ACTN|nr:SGNH/GDSL hydrolase family protein [Kribbella aluminosa]MBP2355011.1 lysophospholipase L1-like esterase [Kribbella aluminosa]